MRSFASWKFLAVVGLFACSRAPAQELPPLPSSVNSEFADPIFAPNQRSSSVETLERLTGQAPESDRERTGERDEIETDRDSFTPATTIAPRHRFILESA